MTYSKQWDFYCLFFYQESCLKNVRIRIKKIHKQKFFKIKAMKRNYKLSIPLLIGFLLLTKIVSAQTFSKTTPSFGKQICIPTTLMDTIIHDLQERKALIRKDSISKLYISHLSDEIDANGNKIWELEKSLLISEKKRVRNGWHRNVLLVLFITLGVICTR